MAALAQSIHWRWMHSADCIALQRHMWMQGCIALKPEVPGCRGLRYTGGRKARYICTYAIYRWAQALARYKFLCTIIMLSSVSSEVDFFKSWQRPAALNNLLGGLVPGCSGAERRCRCRAQVQQQRCPGAWMQCNNRLVYRIVDVSRRGR